MPISNIDLDTFVAFMDISGFKQLMKNKERAWKALDRFYNYGYEVIRRNRQQNNISVEGIFISDCGILFVRACNDNKTESLKALLRVVRELNRKMLDDDFMLTTNIAYGHFKYQERIEFEGIEKNPIYGNAYVSAFFQPGFHSDLQFFSFDSTNNYQLNFLLSEGLTLKNIGLSVKLTAGFNYASVTNSSSFLW